MAIFNKLMFFANINKEPEFDMNCKLKERERYIADYVNGTLRQEDLSRFEEHYFQCRQCFMEVEAVVDAAAIIAAEGKKLTAQPPQQKKAFLNISGLFTAGSGVKWGIALTAASLIIFIILNDNSTNSVDILTSEKETYSDPVITDKESEQTTDSDIAAMTGPSFEPSQYMEDWINETQRSSAAGVKIISPAPGKIFNDEDIPFSWQTPAEPLLYLKILDNMEEEVFSAQITAGKNFLAKKDLFPGSGLYYWRIENEEEVVYTGKFYFLKTDR